MVHEIAEMSEFTTKVIEGSSNKLVVVDFWATWCPPCVMIGPKFAALADLETSVDFYKVDVDKSDEICSAAQISCMPTFLFYKNGEVVDRLEGASEPRLKELVAKHK